MKLRNGFQWRDGRPRWEPSPASRKAGLHGMDLKDGDRWLDRGEAIDACDARSTWATHIRAARAGDAKARGFLERALAGLPAPQTPITRLRRRHLQDLLEAAAQAVAAAPPEALVAPGQHSLQEMVDGYMAAPPLRPGAQGGMPTPPAAETLKAYRTAGRKLVAKFPGRAAGSFSRGEMRAWYLELCQETSIATGNLTLGATSAFYAWAMLQTPPWVTDNPATQLKRSKAPGRIVFWTLREERDFVTWCDANGYEDVADAVTLLAWTGASQVDACKATLPQLAGDSWRYIRQKTERKGGEALAGLLPPVKARIARRAAMTVTVFGAPFLLEPPGEGYGWRAHTRPSLYRRYMLARHGALMAGAVPVTLADKHLQDLRDTCLSRLAWAGVPLDRIPLWSGHSPDSAKEILRAHYLALREQETLEDAALLEAWLVKEGVAL